MPTSPTNILENPALLHGIFKYAFFYDEAIRTLTSLSKLAQTTCYNSLRVMELLYAKYHLCVYTRKQLEKVANRRIVYFKVGIELSPEFDGQDFVKFLKVFEESDLSEELDSKLRISKSMSLKQIFDDRLARLPVSVDIEYIHQYLKQPLPVEFFLKLITQNIIPNFEENLTKKLDLGKRTEIENMIQIAVPSKTSGAVPEPQNRSSDRQGTGPKKKFSRRKNPWVVKDFIRFNPNGTKNEMFKEILGHVELDIDEFHSDLQQIDSTIFSLKLWWWKLNFTIRPQRYKFGSYMKFAQTLLSEHHELEFAVLGKEIRKTPALSENLQILTVFYPPTSWLVQQLFLDLAWPKMEKLREFVCCPVNQGTFWNIMKVLEKDNRDLVKENCPNLEKFGFHFAFIESQEFREMYIKPQDSYIKIEFGNPKAEDNSFFLHFGGDIKGGPFKFNLKGKGQVYALFADNNLHEDYVTLDIVKFVSFEPDYVEEAKEAPCLRPFKEYKDIVETYYPNKGRSRKNPNFENTKCKVEVNIPVKLITKIEICRSSFLTMVPLIKMVGNLKAKNPRIITKLTLSCENFKMMKTQALAYCLQKNSFNELNITSLKDLCQAQKFLEVFIEQNPYLSEFRYPVVDNWETQAVIGDFCAALRYAVIKPIVAE
ncbi:unnamed protein product [Moneuplotes crassus]|uniref:Uncharacterized protein n=1 Tax=Euplotes crassus TaxID=5936 RepID=A0AAD1U1P3_EUPCR|nr:unnamed protein product [Moneuplotes crassus]